MPPRAAGPHPHLEPGPPATDPARLRNAPQSAPAAPLPARGRAAETATRAGRPRPVSRPKTGSRQRPDQRISPGRMTWIRFSASTVPNIRTKAAAPPRPLVRDTWHGAPVVEEAPVLEEGDQWVQPLVRLDADEAVVAGVDVAGGRATLPELRREAVRDVGDLQPVGVGLHLVGDRRCGVAPGVGL